MLAHHLLFINNTFIHCKVLLTLNWCVYCVVLGQLCVLQVCVAVENPVQSLPPYCGAGFVQERVLV